MLKQFVIITATLSLVGLSACTTTGNTERGAAFGATAGAIAGAIIGNNTGSGDAKTGATIGAVVGGAGGAYAGSQQDKAMGEPTRIRQSASGQELMYDRQAGRYYYADGNTGRTYWQNGGVRSY
jgi:phage tail tape-measure protein